MEGRMVMVGSGSGGREIERAAVAEQFTWNVADLFESDAAWGVDKDRIRDAIPGIGAYAGRLRESPAVLADALDLVFGVAKDLSRLRIYADLLHDQDTRDPQRQGMTREMVRLSADFGTVSSFIRPEILEMGAATANEFLEREPRLAIYRVFLDDITRWAGHTLSASEEKLLAAAAPLAGSPRETFEVFANADFPFPTVALTDGTEVRVTQAAYIDLRTRPDRDDRHRVMSAFLGTFGSFSGTFGTMMDGSLQKALYFARARGFDSTLDATLFRSRIPTAVYTNLIEGVNRHLPTLHRYLRLRRRILGVDRLHYHDLYAPLVGEVDVRYAPDEASAMIVASMAPLGRDYQDVLARAFDDRWIDWFPTPGKRSGAYNNGAAYDVHPYILLNYNGSYDAVSTVAHEMGHALHSHYSNSRQPYPTAAYPIFLAEVASTFNEALLIDHMLAGSDDDSFRLSLLGDYLERMRGTLFRQVQFAEFELAMHEMAARGEPITGESLSTLYLDITKRYYGHDEGVTVVDDYVAHEWSIVSHFYREFYVYQYATSLTAAVALSRRVRADDGDATRRYLEFLGSGGSEYPIDALRKAGVDMTTDDALALTIREMERVIDEIETILARRDAAG
jgi:oligoendopeptidase F